VTAGGDRSCCESSKLPCPDGAEGDVCQQQASLPLT
jgi:hypothetical protein